jgi:hypothetical protein
VGRVTDTLGRFETEKNIKKRLKLIRANQVNQHRYTHKGSISPTFYARLFCTKVLPEAFFVLAVKVKILLTQEYWRKCAYKMLMKLTPGFSEITMPSGLM